jgi:hypothetical protein
MQEFEWPKVLKLWEPEEDDLITHITDSFLIEIKKLW